ncbi:MAG: hypothetical protein IIW13_03785 [Paludibacteraceae bacterium]|nr:hypothetical protein [Paludibacteraceae bacterium]
MYECKFENCYWRRKDGVCDCVEEIAEDYQDMFCESYDDWEDVRCEAFHSIQVKEDAEKCYHFIDLRPVLQKYEDAGKILLKKGERQVCIPANVKLRDIEAKYNVSLKNVLLYTSIWVDYWTPSDGVGFFTDMGEILEEIDFAIFDHIKYVHFVPNFEQRQSRIKRLSLQDFIDAEDFTEKTGKNFRW